MLIRRLPFFRNVSCVAKLVEAAERNFSEKNSRRIRLLYDFENVAKLNSWVTPVSQILMLRPKH